MSKSEFLSILRQSLSNEVATNILEQNLSYYEGYISAQSVEDELRIIDGLGDPRLIAKTIIEADRAAKEKSKGNWSGAYYDGNSTEQEEQFSGSSTEYNRNIFVSRMKWYHKLIAVAVIIVLFIVIALIGRLVLGFLFAFGLPILLLLLVMTLFRRR